MDETGYWLNLEKNYDELIDYTRKIEDKLEKIKEIVEDFPLNELEVYRNILQIIEGAEDDEN